MKLSAAIRRQPFADIAREEETELRDDVTALIRAARGMKHPRVRAETLKIAWALWTERGKTGGRKNKPLYRTRRAVEALDSDVEHEHVVTQKFLSWAAVQKLELAEVLMLAEACLTTKDEHRALERVDPLAFGWERYQQAGIEVLESRNFTAVDLDDLAARQRALRDKVEADNGARWDG